MSCHCCTCQVSLVPIRLYSSSLLVSTYSRLILASLTVANLVSSYCGLTKGAPWSMIEGASRASWIWATVWLLSAYSCSRVRRLRVVSHFQLQDVHPIAHYASSVVPPSGLGTELRPLMLQSSSHLPLFRSESRGPFYSALDLQTAQFP